MKATFLITTVFLIMLPLSAQEPAEEMESALEAMESGIPEVTAARLQGWLEAHPQSPEVPEVRTHLVEALLLSSELEKARIEAENLPPDSPRAALLRGRIAAAESRWEEAAASFLQAAGKAEDAEEAGSAQVAGAYCLLQSGAPGEAVEILENLRKSDARAPGIPESLLLADILIRLGKSAGAAAVLESLEFPEGLVPAAYQWIQARLAWDRGEAESTAALLLPLMEKGPGMTRELLAAAHLLRARALSESGEHTSAAALLEDLLEHQPQTPYLPSVFAELDRIYAATEGSKLDILDRWSRIEPFERRQHAVYYGAVQRLRTGRTPGGIHALSTWVEGPEDIPLHAMGRLALAGAFLQNQEPLQAAEQLEALERADLPGTELPRLVYLLGATAFQLERHDEAVRHFQELHEMEDLPGDGRMIALYNLAQSHNASGDYESFLKVYQEFSKAYPESSLRRELVLEEGLLQARNKDPKAQATLQLFVRDFHSHFRLPEAQLGLAELAYHADPPDLEGASMWLAEIDRENAAPEVLEAAEYLSVFLASRRGESADAIEARVDAFLTRYEGSVHSADLLTKAGEIFFREQDYLSAQSMFGRAAEITTGSVAARAHFLAGLAAVRTMNPAALDQALEFFESAARLDGNLQAQSRLEQARVKMRQEQYSDAVLLCQNALAAEPPAPLRYELMMAAAEAEAAATGTSPEAAEKPVAAFLALARLDGVPPLWRNQASWKAARILERAGRREDALLAYYDAFAEDPMAEKVPDFFWFYKAAFDAARLLEEDGKVESAVGVYRRLSILPGPRAPEAAQRLNRLRLEHFLWEE